MEFSVHRVILSTPTFQIILGVFLTQHTCHFTGTGCDRAQIGFWPKQGLNQGQQGSIRTLIIKHNLYVPSWHAMTEAAYFPNGGKGTIHWKKYIYKKLMSLFFYVISCWNYWNVHIMAWKIRTVQHILQCKNKCISTLWSSLTGAIREDIRNANFSVRARKDTTGDCHAWSSHS